MADEPVGEDFDALAFVTEYRRIVAARDAAISGLDRRELDAVAARMRQRWAAWQGEDSLYEMAFGEPWEE